MKFFTEDSIQFLRELPSNNHREWFDANRLRYEKVLKKPFQILVSSLIEKMKQYDNSIYVEPKDCIFRINRDIRFSKDKSPYKNHVSAFIAKGGRKSFSDLGMYIEFSGEHFRLYSGLYELSTLQIQKLRTTILHHEDQFQLLMNQKDFVRVFGSIQGDKYKKIPIEFQSVQTEYIYNKQFYYYTEMKPEFALEENIDQQLIDKFQTCFQLSKFLSDALH